MSGLENLAPLPVANLPKEVREGTAQDKQTYRAALSFEKELVSQLMQSLSQTSKPEDGEDGSGDAGVSTYRQMLPDSLSESVMSAGGTGLAEDLYRALREGASK
ncbi:MAG: rod-binding protein [Thermoleophilaceae bacterium]